MKESLSIAEIERHTDLVEILDWPFDFNIRGRLGESPWFRLRDGPEIALIAVDGSGGMYAICGSAESDAGILFVSSEGSAGVIASNLYQAVQIITFTPYWRDLLKFSGGGQLTQMRRVAPLLEKEIHEDEPLIDQHRSRIIDVLKITNLEDPVGVLHQNVSMHEQSHVVISDEGEACESLFNTFTFEDNPGWRTNL